MHTRSARLWLAIIIAAGAILAALFAVVWGAAPDEWRGILLAAGLVVAVATYVIGHLVVRRLHWG